ncbi:cobalamin biosynthesis protein CobW [Cohaesibacter celericrescens]|uniref:Cobalamin biosynthesis protein CobW n=1 Tax=Cohaesibacter celericrescens TaxID=2067669 RepID=A0A2N5XVU0_9HYPH|nr:cobalamin biosynthesis protein CobW [Cohaesibacter celericrescens]PLW78623.1 cobalamin biosynthesis protein CobW [Cohaesibacter celericrescens]
MTFTPPSVGKKIPATVVTGFLGAGKTTLIRNLIAQAGDKKIALIVNEFGDMGFDGDLLSDCGNPNCTEDDVVELKNGCICCTVADEFLPTMEMLIAREPRPDHIVIETSGLALPQPLVQAFQWPSVRASVTVDGVVTIADASALSEGHYSQNEDAIAKQRALDDNLDHESPIDELFADQLKCADMVVISKADLVDADGIARVEALIGEHARKGVKLIHSSNGNVSAAVLLGLDSEAEQDLDSRKAAHDHHHHDDEEDDHDHDHNHHHDDFHSVVVMPRIFASMDEMKSSVESCLAQAGILRVKGYAAIEGKKARVVVQAVGRRVDCWFDTASNDATGLVVIGLKDFDQSAVEYKLV